MCRGGEYSVMGEVAVICTPASLLRQDIAETVDVGASQSTRLVHSMKDVNASGVVAGELISDLARPVGLIHSSTKRDAQIGARAGSATLLPSRRILSARIGRYNNPRLVVPVIATPEQKDRARNSSSGPVLPRGSTVQSCADRGKGAPFKPVPVLPSGSKCAGP